MAYSKELVDRAKALVGKRIEIPVHYDLWMQGARHGTVVSLKWCKAGNGFEHEVRGIRVRMEHPQVKKIKTVWMIDLDYIKEA